MSVFTRRSGGAANGWTMPYTVPKVTFLKFLLFVLFYILFPCLCSVCIVVVFLQIEIAVFILFLQPAFFIFRAEHKKGRCNLIFMFALNLPISLLSLSSSSTTYSALFLSFPFLLVCATICLSFWFFRTGELSRKFAPSPFSRQLLGVS